MRCAIHPLKETPACAFVVIFTRHEGRWLFSRHRQRDTWETQGGHIEPGETAYEAAVRELYEESGVVAAALAPLCGYCVTDGGAQSWGMLFLAHAGRIDPLPESEIAEARLFDGLPPSLTYPDITPMLFAFVNMQLKEESP